MGERASILGNCYGAQDANVAVLLRLTARLALIGRR